MPNCKICEKSQANLYKDSFIVLTDYCNSGQAITSLTAGTGESCSYRYRGQVPSSLHCSKPTSQAATARGQAWHVELMKMHPPCSLRASQTFEGAGWSGEGTPAR